MASNARVTGTVWRHGFSLLELLFVMAIGTILLGMALSASSYWDRGIRMRNSVTNVKSGLGMARQFAITHQQRTFFSCGNTTTAFSASMRGYYVVSGAIDGIIGNTNYLPDGVTNRWTDYIEFRSDGTCSEGSGWPEGNSRKEVVLSTRDRGTNTLGATITVSRVTGCAQLQE